MQQSHDAWKHIGNMHMRWWELAPRWCRRGRVEMEDDGRAKGTGSKYILLQCKEEAHGVVEGYRLKPCGLFQSTAPGGCAAASHALGVGMYCTTNLVRAFRPAPVGFFPPIPNPKPPTTPGYGGLPLRGWSPSRWHDAEV